MTKEVLSPPRQAGFLCREKSAIKEVRVALHPLLELLEKGGPTGNTLENSQQQQAEDQQAVETERETPARSQASLMTAEQPTAVADATPEAETEAAKPKADSPADAEIEAAKPKSDAPADVEIEAANSKAEVPSQKDQEAAGVSNFSSQLSVIKVAGSGVCLLRWNAPPANIAPATKVVEKLHAAIQDGSIKALQYDFCPPSCRQMSKPRFSSHNVAEYSASYGSGLQAFGLLAQQ